MAFLFIAIEPKLDTMTPEDNDVMGLVSTDVKQMATTDGTEESGTPDSKGSDETTKESNEKKKQSDDALVLDAPDGYIEPNSYDVLLTDITSEKLHGEIAEMLRVVYLSTVPKAEEAQLLQQKTFYGMKYGVNSRFMVNLPCRHSRSKRNHLTSSPRQPPLRFQNIIFLVDTSSPYNYLCQEVMEALLGEGNGGNSVPQFLVVELSPGLKLEFHLSPRSGHFGDVNILGGVSFFQSVDFVSRRRDPDFTLTFD